MRKLEPRGLAARLIFWGDLMLEIVNALQAGDPSRAEALCRVKLRSRPDDEQMLVLLVLSLHHQGRRNEAVEVQRRLVELHPQSALHWSNLATSLGAAGQIHEAIAACEAGLRVAPEDAALLANMGGLKLRQREYEVARDLLLRAHALAPREAEITIKAALAAIACRDYFAEDLLRGWRRWLPLDQDAQFDLAYALMTIGDASGAQFVLEDMVQRSPRNMRALTLLASVYERSNRLPDANRLVALVKAEADDLNADLVHDIDHCQARLLERAGNVKLARDILEARGPRGDDDFDHFFALAQVCDRLDDRSAALAALEKAHALQIIDMRKAAPRRFSAGAPSFPAASYALSAEDYATWPRLEAPVAADSPIFIVGFPRSGTTLLEQMLDAHPQLQSMDERPFFNVLGDDLSAAGLRVPRELQRLQQSDADQLRAAYWSLVRDKIKLSPGTRLVDKNPLNMLWLPLIYRLFPNAKFILALRHPCDVLLSNYFQNFRSVVLGAIAADVETLARGYVTAMQYCLHHVDLLAPDLFVSRYETLVAEPGAQATRIAEFLGLEDPAPLLQSDRRAKEKGYIATPSYTEVIEPINPRRTNRWLRYREAMAPALPILEPMLRLWGYEGDTTYSNSANSGK